MAQSDLTIENQSFPSFRADLNDALTALNTTQSGTSRPSSAVAGTQWLDTTTATTPTLKFFDGTDDISLGVLNYSTNTITYTLADGSVATAKIADDAITTAKIVDDAVTTAKILDANVTLAKLSATGTKDATTFLRGDNTFAEAGGGKVLQVVQTTLTTLLSTTSASFVEASGFNVAITPSSTSSKILVMVTTNTKNTAGDGKTNVTLARGASVLEANGLAFHSQASGATYSFSSSSAFNYLDSPNTTSATTYKVYFLGETGTANLNFNNSVGTITAIEIGA